MKLENINQAMEEASRFILKAKAVKVKELEDKLCFYGCKETAALRRASMDLTRALSKLRQE